MGAAVPWFPFVGGMVGVLIGLIYLGAVELVNPLTAALLAVGAGAMITGAFHEDGLADVADSLGGYTPERRLEIMRDSRVGTFGALSLVIATGLKISALMTFGGADGLLALVLAHAGGRAMTVVALLTSKSARGDGFGSEYAVGVDRRAAWLVTVVAVAALAEGGPAGAVAVGAAVLAMLAVTGLARRAVGGTTGDVLGAVEQVAEIAILVALARLVPEHGWSWS